MSEGAERENSLVEGGKHGKIWVGDLPVFPSSCALSGESIGDFQPERDSSACRALDGGYDGGAGLFGAAPAEHLDPLAVFEVLVVLEEVLDLLERDVRQILVLVDGLVAAGQPRDRQWRRFFRRP